MAGDDKTVRRFLMSGADAKDPGKLRELFEALKGRPATLEELAELAAESEPPSEK